jgi:hypothetical protein
LFLVNVHFWDFPRLFTALLLRLMVLVEIALLLLAIQLLPIPFSVGIHYKSLCVDLNFISFEDLL